MVLHKHLFYLIIFISLSFSCSVLNSLSNENKVFRIASVNNNVCKRLNDKVIIYAIFVDSKYTNPWTEYDINSTLDSINRAITWLEKQSSINGKPLEIELDFHQNEKKVIPIEGRLSKKTLSATLNSPGVLKNLDRWADKIGNTALRTFDPDTAIITNTKIKPKDRERLIARLRDQHKTDNVALMYFINNYYRTEPSCAVHCSEDDSPEYAIVSFKYPAVIAHEFLHLFGAWDLYITPYDTNRKAIKKKAFAMKEFPNEIMAFSYRSLDSLEISPITKYLIGWEKELEDRYKRMIIGKKLQVAKY